MNALKRFNIKINFFNNIKVASRREPNLEPANGFKFSTALNDMHMTLFIVNESLSI